MGHSHVLLVEDNPGDVDLTREGLEDMSVNVHVVGDGTEALRFLRRSNGFAHVPQPHLVLLDLSLPGRGGLDVLGEIKTDAQLRVIPVVVLSSSNADHDVASAYQLHANSYFTKPMELEGFMHTVYTIGRYWCYEVRSPSS